MPELLYLMSDDSRIPVIRHFVSKENTMKKNVHVLCCGTLVLAAFLAIPASMTTAEESQATQTIKSFLSGGLCIEAARVTERPDVSYDSVGMPYKWYSVDDTYRLWVSLDGEKVYRFTHNRWGCNELHLVEGKTHDDAISETEAFASVVPLLSYLGFSTEQNEYEIEFKDTAYQTDQRINDLWGARWYIRKAFSLDGIKCRSRYLTIIVSAASGAVVGFHHNPVIPPENTLNPIVPYSAAEQIALAWITAHPYFAEANPTIAADSSQEQIVIAQKYDFYGESMVGRTVPISTYYSWVVIFDFVEFGRAYQCGVWVNIETGEVVGSG